MPSDDAPRDRPRRLRPPSPGNRSLAVGMYWASQVMSLVFEFGFPVGLGVGADLYWGTTPVGILTGAVVGFGLFGLHLRDMMRRLDEASAADRRRREHAENRPERGAKS